MVLQHPRRDIEEQRVVARSVTRLRWKVPRDAAGQGTTRTATGS
jgi:hypothetical protein